MTVTCPEGHASQATDYCDVCGTPIPAGAASAALSGGPGTGTGQPGAEPGGSTAEPGETGPVTCPNCGDLSPAGSLFCENCGYDFTTGTPAPPPPASGLDLGDLGATQPPSRPAPGPAAPASGPVPTPGLPSTSPPAQGADGAGQPSTGQLVQGLKRVAMEYVPRNANPYVSRVDAGTVELVRSFGVEIVPSGDLIQRFEAVLDDEQRASHFEAARHTDSAFGRVWQFIADRVGAEGAVEEAAVQQLIMDHFAEHGMTTYHPPIVGVGPNSGNPACHMAPATPNIRTSLNTTPAANIATHSAWSSRAARGSFSPRRRS